MSIIITVPADLEPALVDAARRAGKSPEQFAVDALRPTLAATPGPDADGEWLTLLRRNRVNAGMALSDEAVSRESIYD